MRSRAVVVDQAASRPAPEQRQVRERAAGPCSAIRRSSSGPHTGAEVAHARRPVRAAPEAGSRARWHGRSAPAPRARGARGLRHGDDALGELAGARAVDEPRLGDRLAEDLLDRETVEHGLERLALPTTTPAAVRSRPVL